VIVRISGINALTGLPLTAQDINFGNDDNLDGDNNPFTRLTDAAGQWAYEVVPPGTYTITEIQPRGFLAGKEQNADPNLPAPTSGDNVVKGVVASSYFSNIVDGPGHVRGPFNFGELRPITIAGIVFHDLNNDGVRQGSEGVVPGAVLTLTGRDDLGNPVLRTAVANSAGAFQFTNLRPSSAAGYSITVTAPNRSWAVGKTSGPRGAFTIGRVSGVVATVGMDLVDFEFGLIGNGDTTPSKKNLLV
jgi:hypothetical protein